MDTITDQPERQIGINRYIMECKFKLGFRTFVLQGGN